MTNDLLTTAVLIIAIAIMSASMGMMFGAMYEGFLARRLESDEVATTPSRGNREEFPGQRRGGGTHAVEEVARKNSRDEFPGRRQGGGGGDNGGSPPAGGKADLARRSPRDEFPRDTKPGTAPGGAVPETLEEDYTA